MRVVWKIVLVYVLLSAKYTDASAQGVVWGIRTQDSTVVDPHYPMIAAYPAPAEYRVWMADAARCAKLTLPDSLIDKMEFIEVNAPDFKINDDGPLDYPSLAVSVVSEGRVYISVQQIHSRHVVTHELLHFALYLKFGLAYLLQPDSHPADYFDKCGLYTAKERARER